MRKKEFEEKRAGWDAQLRLMMDSYRYCECNPAEAIITTPDLLYFARNLSDEIAHYGKRLRRERIGLRAINAVFSLLPLIKNDDMPLRENGRRINETDSLCNGLEYFAARAEDHLDLVKREMDLEFSSMTNEIFYKVR